jgi:GrpB-like predicted nucleotidyltransferase (UPF0157 family)
MFPGGPTLARMPPSDADILRHHDDAPPPGADPYLPGHAQTPYPIRIEEYDDEWPRRFADAHSLIRRALGDRVLELHHVGSTAVPGLAAKPFVDADLVVADPADEASYIPDLEAVGFSHRIREPWWHEHRLLVQDAPRVVLHVFGPDCPEVIRHLMFRDWLRGQPDERERYAAAKRAAANATNAEGGHGMDYNAHKQAVVREIYDRMFRANGLR